MTTGYADDILPLFRQIDINCMTPNGVHLGDAQWMCNATAGSGFDDHGNARRVFAPVGSLGPLLPEWYFTSPGQPPIFEGMPGLNQIATSADFVWSVPFCVYIDTQDPIVPSGCAGK